MLFLGVKQGIQQLMHPESRKTLGASLILTILFYLIFGAVAFSVLGSWTESFVPPDWMGDFLASFLKAFTWAVGIGVFLVCSVLCFRVAVHLSLSLFLDTAVEKLVHRAPELGPWRGGDSAIRTARDSLSTLFRSLRLHLLWSPIYLLSLLIFPPLSLLLFFKVDGSLYAREVFLQVSPLLLEPEKREELWKGRGMYWNLWGAFFSVLITVPFLNLAVPLLATYSMVYVLNGRDSDRE